MDKEQIKFYNKKYRETHKEQLKAYQKKYYETHKEQKNAYQRKYRQEHKEEVRAYSRNYSRNYNRKKYNEELLINKVRDIEDLENELKYVEDKLFINDYLLNLRGVLI